MAKKKKGKITKKSSCLRNTWALLNSFRVNYILMRLFTLFILFFLGFKRSRSTMKRLWSRVDAVLWPQMEV